MCMAKERVNLSIDGEVIKSAKEVFMNLSDIAEKAFKERLNIKEVEIKRGDNCEFCRKKDREASKDDLYGLNWLWPEELWICPDCLQNKVELLKQTKGAN